MTYLKRLFNGRINSTTNSIGQACNFILLIGGILFELFCVTFYEGINSIHFPNYDFMYPVICINFAFYLFVDKSLQMRYLHNENRSFTFRLFASPTWAPDVITKNSMKPNKYGPPPPPGFSLKSLLAII